MGITSLILANLLMLTAVVLLWSAWNMRGAGITAAKTAKRGTGELHSGKTGSLAAS
jgi:hypothetical protein